MAGQELVAPDVEDAVLAGLVECLDPLGAYVFPGEPAGSYEASGSVWVSGLESESDVESLGADGNHDETVTVVAKFSAHCESAESHMDAYKQARGRVNELLNAYRAWLSEHPHLPNDDGDPLVDWFAVGKAAWEPQLTDKGWGAEVTLSITAHYSPPTP